MNTQIADLQFKAVGVFLKAKTDEGRRLIRGHASTGDLDRQGEVITLSALIGAKNDLVGKAVFLNHKHSELPVGKVIDADIDEKGLLVTVEFTKADFATDLWKLIEEGIMSRFSIGGMVKEAEEKQDKMTGAYFVEITKIELFEVSIVGLPANDQARFEPVSKSFNMAIAEEIKKREVKPTMSKEIKKEEVLEETTELTSETVEATVTEGTVAKEEEEVVEDKVEEANEEVVEKTTDEVEKTEEVVGEVVDSETPAEENKEEVTDETSLEVEAEVVEPTEAVEEVVEKVEEVIEKSTDEKILETLNLILQYVSKDSKKEVVDEVVEEVETPVKEITDEVEAEVVEEVAEVVKEAPVEEVKEEVVEKAVEEKDKEEKVNLDSLRKGEVVIVDTPYANGEETPKINEQEIKKAKEAAWTKMIFGNR